MAEPISPVVNPAAPGPQSAPSQAPAPPSQEEQRLAGVSRSLIIGVGGTGHKIMLDVRSRLTQKYGSMAKVPIISFLLIDTDQAIFQKNPNYSDAANLDAADLIHTGVQDVETLRRKLAEPPKLRDRLAHRVARASALRPSVEGVARGGFPVGKRPAITGDDANGGADVYGVDVRGAWDAEVSRTFSA